MINVTTAAIGLTRAKIPPTIEIIPITIWITLEDFELARNTNPSIIFEIPTINKAIPRKATYNNAVSSGFAITHPDNAMAIAPKII